MLKKKTILLFLTIMILHSACFAADTWFYTDNEGAEYYLSDVGHAHAWICGYVSKVKEGEQPVSLIYQFFHYQEVPYHIYYGDDVMHPVEAIKEGSLRVDDNADESAIALYESPLLWQ